MICNERRDEWLVEVFGRMECVNDLCVVDVVYY